MVPDQPGDDVVELSVRLGVDGRPRVALREIDFVADTTTTLQTLLLPQTFSADQVVLRLSHLAHTGVVTASVDYLWNGSLVGSQSFSQTASIFTNEVWTRAEFVASAPATTGSSLAGTYGTLTIDASGTWHYALDNSLPAVQRLTTGETVHDSFTIVVTDEFGASDTRVIAIPVMGVNDAPVITLQHGLTAATAILVPEMSAGAFVTVSATDAELQPLTWSIGGNPDGSFDNGFFIVDPAPGALRFAASPDFEFTDPGNDDLYKVRVTVHDSLGASDHQDIFVRVTNVNEAPIARDDTAAGYSTSEDIAVALFVLGNDTDPDGDQLVIAGLGDAGAAEIFTALGARVTTDGSAVSYDPRAAGPLQALLPGQSLTDSFTYTLRDPGGLTSQATVAIVVQGERDLPTITFAGGMTADAAVLVPENTAGSFAIVVASGGDGGPLTWSIGDSPDPSFDNSFFAVDPATGALRFKDPPDFEFADPGNDDLYKVRVTVSDMHGASDSQDIFVRVTDVNEAPAVTLLSAPAALVEATTADPGVAGAQALLRKSDVDGGLFLHFDISLMLAQGWVAAGTQQISKAGSYGTATLTYDNAGSDLATLAYALDNAAANPLRAGQEVTETFEVYASDGLLVGSRTVDFRVIGTNEAPIITFAAGATPAQAILVPELTAGAFATITATDADGDAPSWSIGLSPDGSYDNEAFGIDPATGALRFAAPPDFEFTDPGNDDLYKVRMTASDASGASASRDIFVQVTNVEEAPIITFSGGATPATAILVAENTAGPFITMTGLDPDGGALTWSIGPNPASTWDNGSFVIDPLTGAIAFVAPPDFEFVDPGNDDLYLLRATATDGAGLAAYRDIFVQVTDVAEPAGWMM